MMRLLCVTAMAGALTACQTSEPGPDYTQDMTRLLEFHQALEQRDDAALVSEAEQIRDLLVLGTDVPPTLHLRLLMVETQLKLRELQQLHDQQVQQIDSLRTQIAALTAIEQQINRRGQMQETVNE